MDENQRHLAHLRHRLKGALKDVGVNGLVLAPERGDSFVTLRLPDFGVEALCDVLEGMFTGEPPPPLDQDLRGEVRADG